MYGYGLGMGPSSNGLSIAFLLGFLAFVGAIVITVLLYRKFIATDNFYKLTNFKHDWGPFFRFEHLIVENILKVFYIFFGSLIACESAAAIINSFLSIVNDPGGTLVFIIVILILCLVFELLTRLWFEFTLLTILIWKNTSAIRKSVGGTVDGLRGGQPAKPAPAAPSAQQPTQAGYGASYYGTPATPAGSATSAPKQPSGAPSAPAQPASPTPHTSAPQPVVDPSQSGSVHSNKSHQGGWTCPQCGTFNKTGIFCAQCGTRKQD